jgi:hypothetical protein
MSTLDCLCCRKSLPATDLKVCPSCGHVFQGNGWDGIDAHWRARHESEMPYKTFWATLCDAHRGRGVKERGE